MRKYLIAFSFLMPTISKSQSNSFFNRNAERETISERWELYSSRRRGTFVVTPYKPIYVTAGRYSTSPNVQPFSENPAYSSPVKFNYNNYETKFQLSFKTKIFENIFRSNTDLWMGYSQKAHWQIYNEKVSRPSRELNYEPELILNHAVNILFLGFNIRMLGVAFNHQSNGKSLPLSRSWNRIIFQAGIDKENWQIYLRSWLRLTDKEDENPAITNYIGRCEAVVIHNIGKHQISVIGTHTLRFNKNNRGSIQGNWVFPIKGNFKGQVQVADGYGETLIDYNHPQFTYGLSVSLVEW